MKVTRPAIVDVDHADYVNIKVIEAELLRLGKGIERIRSEIPKLLRKALDEVIDAPRTGRLTIDELEQPEKTYIGTKIEIVLRNFFGLPRGLLISKFVILTST